MNATPDTGERVGVVSDEHVVSFQALRPRLVAIASRVLRDPAEADDVVQDAWVRWQGTDRADVRDAGAFLVTTTRRLAINVADSARARRETYVGPWLHERVDAGGDPALDAQRRDALELALLILMERLSPAERGAYVLREAFDYPYRRIAHVLALTEANARQLVTRARGHLSGRSRIPVHAGEQRRFVAAFVAAAETGELTTLEDLLRTDVVGHSDRGGAARIPMIGPARTSRLPVGVAA